MKNFLLLLSFIITTACQVKSDDPQGVLSASTPSPYTTLLTATTNVLADGVETSIISINVKIDGEAIAGESPTFTVTGTGNTIGSCSVTDSEGNSICTLKSTKAEIKSLRVLKPTLSPITSVKFLPGSVDVTTTTITGTGPTIANGTSSSKVTVTLKDAFNNLIPGVIPTFVATDTGSTNNYGLCSSSNSSGVSTCTLKSTKAETKILTLLTPIEKNGPSVIFKPGLPLAANSSISGTGPVDANGLANSTVTIILKDAFNNPTIGLIPTFDATDSGITNSYGACSASNEEGLSTCFLSSLTAEDKTLSLVSPVAKLGGIVSFISVGADALNSTITGTGPVIANGVASSIITITLKDAQNLPVSGQTPVFSATDSNSTNTYGACSLSDSNGISICSLTSTKAEIKTLSLLSPVSKIGESVLFLAGSPDAGHTSISGSSPVNADGISLSYITISIADAFNNPVMSVIPIFNATDTNNSNLYGPCSQTDFTGTSHCSLSSTKAEAKILQLTSPVAVTGSESVTFSSTLPSALHSTISGSGPVTADGVAESMITIILKDSNQNIVSGVTPNFDATDSDALNEYGLCSMSDLSGVSICNLKSKRAEGKTLRITTPILKSGDTITFLSGPAVAETSLISGTGPVVANGSSSSTISINLKDANNNPVIGIIPTFDATNTDNQNSKGECSPTNSAGSSICSLKSIKAEPKTPQILTPVNKVGSEILFVSDVAIAENSSISGTGPVNPDGTSTSIITITLKDSNLNNVTNVIPTFEASGLENNLGNCSASNVNGISICSLSSTHAEIKTLSLTTPVSKVGENVTFQTGTPSPENCTITGTGPVLADGISSSTVMITLKDNQNLAVIGVTPTFATDGSNNIVGACSPTNISGTSICSLKSTKSETKSLQIVDPIFKTGESVVFLPGSPSSLTSTITASGPVLADGSDVSTVTITLKDDFGNYIPEITPSFAMTGSLNSYGLCSISDYSGVSTCTASSLKAEEKTFSLLSPVSVTGNSVDFNPNGLNLQVPIEMVDRGLSSNTTATTFSRSRTSLNTLDYVAQSNLFMFEVIAENTSTTTAYTIYLVNNAGTQVTDSAITVPPSTVPTRFNVLWTPSIGPNDYRIKLPATPTTNVLKVHSAKMIVEQTAAVATKIYIPLAGGDTTGESTSDTSAAFVASTASTSFVQPTLSNFYLWQRSDSSYDAIASGNAWTLETISTISNATGTSSVALFDKINNQQIIEATTNVTGTTLPSFRQVSFSSGATNFNDGDTLELRLKSSSASYNARLLKAGLWLKLKFLKKSDIYFRLANRRSASSSVAIADARFLWDEGAWSNPNVYFQTNANGTGSSLSLQDHGTNDSGTTTPTMVPGSLIVPTATYSVQKSGVLTLTNMNRYFIQHTRTTGTVVLGGAFILIRTHD